MPPAGNWLRFSGSIPPLFVLSPICQRLTLRANWLRFGAFVTPLAPSLVIHWPPFSPHSSRSTPAGSALAAGLFPAGYCQPPTAELTKTERGPISTSGPSIFSMSQKRAIASGESNFSFPLAAPQPLAALSWWVALKASGSRRACRMAVSPNAQRCISLIRSDQTRIVKQRALPDQPFLFSIGISRFGPRTVNLRVTFVRAGRVGLVQDRFGIEPEGRRESLGCEDCST